MRGVTPHEVLQPVVVQISTRTPHAGVTGSCVPPYHIVIFQPALPMRGVTGQVERIGVGVKISTRTPHAGSDPPLTCLGFNFPYFNPHSPCGE